MFFKSKRNSIKAKHGVAATSQIIASKIGLDILKVKQGNCIDAAIAIAASLNVTEPTSCGIGGDMFALYFDNSSKEIFGINGSGRAPSSLTLDLVKHQNISGKSLPTEHIHTVTVPGAVAGFLDLLEKFGTLEREEVFSPAIKLAQNGFQVAPLTAYLWEKGKEKLLSNKYGNELLLNGQAPRSGDIMKNPTLANSFSEIVENGKDGFYKGRIAESIVSLVQKHGGMLDLEDLSQHNSEWVNPISIDYNGVTIWEIPPNGQGITALLALNILKQYDFSNIEHLSVEYFHLLIESLRLAFADSRWYVADQEFEHVPVEELLSLSYSKSRKELINFDTCSDDFKHGSPFVSSDTVYFTTADKDGNACSFIYSNYDGFGTGFVPEGCGFTLQNRGANFSLHQDHPNVLAPGKRPYHTIIPGMATFSDTNDLFASFGVMGGFMQPQGHVQVLLNMLEYGLDPQHALDIPRFCIEGGNTSGAIFMEEGIPNTTIKGLEFKGHSLKYVKGFDRTVFGRGQIIKKLESDNYLAGSDRRSDGIALGY